MAENTKRYLPRRRMVIACVAFLLAAYIGWSLGGGWLWRTVVPPRQPVHLRIIFSNETHGPVTLLGVRVGAKSEVTNVDLPTLEEGSRAFFDFVQANYVEPVELEYRVGFQAASRRLAFVSDARRMGECEVTISIAPTDHASTCGSVDPDHYVDWDPWMFGVPRSTGQP